VKALSSGILNKMIGEQVTLRSSMDYYAMIIWALVVLILAILFVPRAKRVILAFRSKFVPY
jgi:high-affinity Fe2+/Pb2+ permease